MIAYKTVESIDNKLFSYNWAYIRGAYDAGLVLEYIPGEITRPKIQGSKLFICKTIEDAKLFGCSYSREIWECEVDNIETLSFPSSTALLNNANTCWHNGVFVASCSILIHWSKTRFCNEVKLIKRVRRIKPKLSP